MTHRIWLLPAALVLALAAGCATTSAPATIAETAAKTPELSTLNKLINDAGLAQTLSAEGPYTVFAPSDAAFKAVPAKTMDELAKDKELLKSVLTYHVVPGKLASSDVKNGNTKTVQGANVALAKAGTFVTVEDAMVTQADLPATNGVVHVIDRVLMPPKK
ncbi:fasciclin domain-containing protein [Methylibium rhizosphaerae]|uniref:fasciclin domain-containing protein n=1 Tax=Methylibium rhizosphaerae TaxID=2570323 RepID=UPI00112A6007|nr:fasciclin domain-containing protein [Methylibium rhizosphaerae]